MKLPILTCAVAAALALPATAAAQHGHHHHESAGVQKDAVMTVHQVATDAVELRLGPFNLPAHTPHDAMPQAPDFFWDVPFDGWLVSYAPSLIDESGTDIEAKLLHHVAFWNPARQDFLCPNKEEHIFGAGAELTRWPPLVGFGYAVHHGDRIRISSMFRNPTGTSYPKVYLAIQVDYVKAGPESGVPPVRSVYPVWLDVMECGESDYDLKEGESVKSADLRMPQAGLLLAMGGHLHDYGHALVVTDATRKEQIARLTPELDDKGMLASMPVVSFISRGGFPVGAGDKIHVAAEYLNTSGQSVPDGAMGIAVGYFLPDDPAAMNAYRGAPVVKKEKKK
ncbi:MAG TPA: hypothetical protein VMV61_04280 [Patescibacteria group bacterium]|nr:hypothetical protein [Patescibacteria group bacterium]